MRAREIALALVVCSACGGGDDGANLQLTLGQVSRVELLVQVSAQPEDATDEPVPIDVVEPEVGLRIDGRSRVVYGSALGHGPVAVERTIVLGVEPGDQLRLGFPHPLRPAVPTGFTAQLAVRFTPRPGAVRHVALTPCGIGGDPVDGGDGTATITFTIHHNGGLCPDRPTLALLAFDADGTPRAAVVREVGLDSSFQRLDVTAPFADLPTFPVAVTGLPPEVTAVRARRTAVAGPGGALELASAIVAPTGGAAALAVPVLPEFPSALRLVVDGTRTGAVGIQRHETVLFTGATDATVDWSAHPLPWFATAPTVVSPFTWTQVGEGAPDATVLEGEGEVVITVPEHRVTTTFAPGVAGAGEVAIRAPGAIVDRALLIDHGELADYDGFRTEPEAAAYDPLFAGQWRVLSIAPASLAE